MTALPSEIEAAVAEGVEIRSLCAPKEILVDEQNHVTGFVAEPQMVSGISNGRTGIRPSGEPDITFPCDVLIVAIGQAVDSSHFKAAGLPADRGCFLIDRCGGFEEFPDVFAGGDCVTGPATVIRAIAGGKVAAANIDEYLGYHHSYRENISIPEAADNYRQHIGRVNLNERFARERKNDFDLIELNMSHEEAMQECSKCLRCDVFGSGCMEGGLV